MRAKHHMTVATYVPAQDAIKIIETIGRKPRGKDFLVALKEKHKIK